MNPRPDISDDLIHFTSGSDYQSAYERICQIVACGSIHGAGSKIKGGYPCVCFSEAPLTSLKYGLVNPAAYSRYSPFGIRFKKEWIFERGGRPVIYQPDSEFNLLPDTLRWRHMRYEPGGIDFTWEREWRVNCSELQFTPEVASVVMPNKEWAERLIQDHAQEQEFQVRQYSLFMDEQLAEQYRERFVWTIWLLN